MAKVLIVKDNTSIPDNNIGDVLATYEAQINVYSKDDFLNLIEFDELSAALIGGDPQEIYNAKYNLARKVCKKEQLLILDDIFDVVEFETKSLQQLQDDLKVVTPVQKQFWIDPETNEAKELKESPSKPVRWDGEKFVHNFDNIENSEVLNPTGTIEK